VTSYQLAYWVTEASGCPLGEGFLDLVPAMQIRMAGRDAKLKLGAVVSLIAAPFFAIINS